MTALNKHAELRKELSNPANGSNHHLRKLALSLLDDLETKEAQRANWFQMAQKLGEDLDAAEKRIAELEAREVELPKPISVLHRRDFNDVHRAIYAYPEAELNAALATAGIGVKGE